jgi:hypothetical protein
MSNPGAIQEQSRSNPGAIQEQSRSNPGAIHEQSGKTRVPLHKVMSLSGNNDCRSPILPFQNSSHYPALSLLTDKSSSVCYLVLHHLFLVAFSSLSSVTMYSFDNTFVKKVQTKTGTGLSLSQNLYAQAGFPCGSSHTVTFPTRSMT